MANEAEKNIKNKNLWDVMTGGQKFLLGMFSAVIVASCIFACVKLTQVDFAKIFPEKTEITAEKIADNLSDKELYRMNLENQTAKKVQNVLEKIAGKDNVSVQVNAEIDFNSTKATIEKYKPVSASLTEKEIRQIESEPGAVKRITVAVAVNKILTTKEKQELKDLIASAAGVDFSRGDTVSVSDLRFLGLAEAKAEQTELAQKAQIAMIFNAFVNDLLPLGIWLALGIMAIIAVKQIFGGKQEKTIYTPSVQTSINYDYEPISSVTFAENEQLSQSYDNVEQEKPSAEIGQIKEELNKTILSNTQDAAKLLTSYIKD